MKKIILLILISIITLTIFAQTNSNVVFIFNNVSQFTNQFNHKENSKEFNFKIKNLNDSEFNSFVNKIKSYRGVEEFSLSKEKNGEIIAHLKLYKYADYWKYYEYFFSKNNIYKIYIGKNEYNPAQIGNL